MNVKQLKEAIKDLPDDMEVLLQKDSEGNGYSPLRGAAPDCIYVADNRWEGQVYNTDDSAADNCMEENEWEELKTGPRSLILHPIN